LLGARKDIDMKVIRAVGNADMKLSDDAIRILRAIRFAARFNFTIDSELESSINKNKYLLDQIDDKRKQKEIDKILACENGAQLLNKFGIIVNR
jgi:tRNA nucleotidyltransferase (CCA-adding enzyme)